MALVYPNTYYVGMSNLGLQTIYGYLNARDDVCCERAFLPDREMLPLYQQTRTPLFSLESKTPLQAFDLVAFSVSFENDYLNILTILELSGISLTSDERKAEEPCVIVGGAVTTINPEPLAMFIDLFVIGDGEPLLDKLIETYQQCAGHHTKRVFLEQAAEIPGVYVPACYEAAYDDTGHLCQFAPKQHAPKTVAQSTLRDLGGHPAYSRILTEDTEFGGLFLLQLNRGCSYRCRFCHTGYSQPSLRHLPRDIALRLIRQGMQSRERIGLVGAAVAEYPHLADICQAIVSRGGKISVSSLRVSALAKTEFLIKALIDGGQKTLAVAPEAGTERLRKLVRKALPDSVLMEAFDYLARIPLVNLKLYFLIGLPTETPEDIEAIIELCHTCWQTLEKAAKYRGTRAKITISLNPFVPKPFTPLQWCGMTAESELKRRIQRIKRGVNRLHYVEVIHEAPKWAVWQGILARGDRRLGQILLLTLRYHGDWKKAFRELHRDPGFYVYRNRNTDEMFPWSHLHVGTSHQALLDEYQSIITGNGVKG